MRALESRRARWTIAAVAFGALSGISAAEAQLPVDDFVLPALQPVTATSDDTPPRTTSTARQYAQTVAIIDRPVPAAPFGERDAILTELKRLTDNVRRIDPAQGVADAEATVGRAVALGDAALIVDAQLALGRAHVFNGQPERAAEHALAAFRVGERAQVHAGAARAASLYIGDIRPSTDQWHRWVRLTELHINLAGGVLDAERRLAQALAVDARHDGRLDEALMHRVRYLELIGEELGPMHSEAGVAHGHIALLYERLEDHRTAEDHWRQALDIFSNGLPSETDNAHAAAGALGRVLSEQGKHIEAAHYLQRVLDYAGSTPSTHPRVASAQGESLWLLGRMMFELGHNDRALAYLAQVEPLLREDEPENGLMLHQLKADIRIAQEQPVLAIAELEAGLSYVDVDEPEWPERIEAREQLARLRSQTDAG